MQSAPPVCPRAAAFLIIALAAMSNSASAQQTPASKGPAPVYGLDLKAHAALPSGKVAGAGGTVERAGHRFQLEHLDLMQPMVVAVIAENPSRSIDVRLAKYNFDSVEREGRTDSSGRALFKFRTEGDLRILVRAATGEPSPYSLVVWVGEEIVGDVGAPFVPMKKRSRLDRFLPFSAPFAAGALGALACAGLAVLLLRPLRRRRTAATKQSAVALLVVSLCATGTGAAQTIRSMGEALSPTALSTAAVADALKKVDVIALQQEAEKLSKNPERLRNYDPLSPSDESMLQDSEPPGMPELPSNCWNSEECRKCFPPANDRLKRVLRTLEKLRRIGTWTKAYKDNAIAFGSSIASIQGAGLGWPGARNQIDQSYVKFQGIYDAKYNELISSLKGSLQDISACEESVYQEHDWYNRFGFIYYQFMAQRYRRTD